MHKMPSVCRLTVILIFLAAVTFRASATVFTTNTDIGLFDTNYDGQAIVISNCTVTVDGPHTFSSLTVATNGILTHSFLPNGQYLFSIVVTNSPIVLTGTSPSAVGSNIFTPLLVTDQSQNIVYTNGVDYLEIISTNAGSTYTDIERTTNSSIPDGGTVLVSFSYDETAAVGLDLTVTGTVLVAGEIDADGIGYGAGLGPGAGSSSGSGYFDGSGGGDGGSGGVSLDFAIGGICYDSLYQPALPGSGGGASYAGTGGNGGGLIQISAGGNVEIDGLITANGQSATNARAGGGSGGGIWISAPSLSGAGSISVNGGAGAPGYGGGGGGGRIGIVCGTNNFTGTITAYGGSGGTYTWNHGGAGTIFTQLAGQLGSLTMDNGGTLGSSSTVALPTMANVSVSDGAALDASGNLSVSNVVIGTNGVLSLNSGGFQDMSSLTIAPGGLLSGYLSNESSGAGTYTTGGITYGGGGGYGGNGGAAAVTNAVGGGNYGYLVTPTGSGSEGGGGDSSPGGLGGGVVEVNVSGTILVNGTISVNGENGFGTAGGGGSGGSVYILAGTISGNGSITANGGAGASLGGGGGGGRISIDAQQNNSFTGAIIAYGGGGANFGGAGTVFVESPGGTAQEELVVDNGGNVGPPTVLQAFNGGNLIIQNGGWAVNATTLTANSLMIGSNSWLTAYQYNPSATLSVISNATIQAGGGITLDSQGYGPNTAPNGGAGYSYASPYGGGGGGNGGFGGYGVASGGYTAFGGPGGYNYVNAPNLAGSGGGGDISYSTGGNGGGVFGLHVSGTLLENGTITANGGNGSGAGGGGGAGGSLTISAGLLSGSGSITANGGNGANANGGGGGGGCIAMTFGTNLFTGTISALGGEGANYGGAGTIYFKTNSAVNGQIVMDNGGQNGAGSGVLSSSSANDLTLSGGSRFITPNSASLTFGNVLITNASMVITNGTLNVTANNITVQNGGAIIANAGGFQQNLGPDAGRSTSLFPNYPCGGGGNGGCGGNAISNSAAGGGGYGAYTSVEQGSGGGGYASDSFGGAGGGIIELNVSRVLTVNGTISANGVNGSGYGGGGGAGGSLALTVNSVNGSGSIAANGGNGANGIGGGGGGGIIAINFNSSLSSNLFAGVLSAYGGHGGTNGGAGTILIRTNVFNTATLIVDNGGNVGTNTPILSESSSYNLQVRNGGVLALENSSQFQNVLVTSNAWIEPGSSAGEVQLSVSQVATISAGGGIIADSFGSGQNAGEGSGRYSTSSPLYPCSGAGYDGSGGFSISNDVPGGNAYGSLSFPLVVGSGGGGFSPYSSGGSGGGIIDLSLPITGVLQIYGSISANGGNGSGTGGGGGSGGSIDISAGSITGNGSITANGGNGAAAGGGGGGGQIFLNYTRVVITNPFVGPMTAYGGGGANYGGAGDVYVQTNGITSGQLLLDNDGNVGTNTPLQSVSGNITIQNGAIGIMGTGVGWDLNNLLILSNSALTVLSGASSEFIVEATNITIATGGTFTIDGDGLPAQAGLGAGILNDGIAVGGGHGGYGGGIFYGGGGAYDSIQSPQQLGSGGANSSTGAPGGSGGGNLIIEVANNMVVNGRLSANGLPGGSNAGGGAGGSIYLENVPNLSGSGVISANGGASLGSGGGGGGGRIALTCTSDNFAGQFTTSGGPGGYPGGAGTVYLNVSGAQTVIANNGGVAGTNTPLSSAFSLPSSPFELDISGGATVVPVTPLPILSNLNISASSTLTMPAAQSNLFVGVINNANIAGNLDVDNLGYFQSIGPGAGTSQDNEGSGAGYGGAGGASDSGAPGGGTYGTASAPINFGSGGGGGAHTTPFGGSAGGGALRLSVLGTLAVSGDISANGDSGLQDDSGGGAGGSVWISAGTLSGAGNISAYGGDGVFSGGGGGGGGRIAIYAQNNQFTGTTNVSGGAGAGPGQPGTIFLSTALNGLQVVSQSPTGVVMSTVSSVNVLFSDMLNAASVSASDFAVTTPAGPLAQTGLTVTVQSPFSVQLSFPAQNTVGTYTVQVQGPVSDMAGALLQPYSGTFTITMPTISGTVKNTSGVGVAGVSIQASGGLAAATTDSNGNYSLPVPPDWTGTVTPSSASYIFNPLSVSYTSVSGNIPNQNYSAQNISPSLATTVSAGNFSLNWTGISGVTYQVLWSTNLVTWQPLGSSITGTNGPMQIELPTGSNAAEFFRIQVAN